MTIHFIGAGPGSADLLTLRAKKIISISNTANVVNTWEILYFCNLHEILMIFVVVFGGYALEKPNTDMHTLIHAWSIFTNQ